MERLNIRVAVRGKVQPLHTIAATVSPQKSLAASGKKNDVWRRKVRRKRNRVCRIRNSIGRRCSSDV